METIIDEKLIPNKEFLPNEYYYIKSLVTSSSQISPNKLIFVGFRENWPLCELNRLLKEVIGTEEIVKFIVRKFNGQIFVHIF